MNALLKNYSDKNTDDNSFVSSIKNSFKKLPILFLILLENILNALFKNYSDSTDDHSFVSNVKNSFKKITYFIFDLIIKYIACFVQKLC